VTESRRYEIHEDVTLHAPKEEAGTLDLWNPVIPETPYQRVLDMEVRAPGRWRIQHEAEFGNLVFHCQLAAPESAVRVQFRYIVERLPFVHRLDEALVDRVTTPDLFSRALSPEQFVNVDEKTRALAHEIVGRETNILSQARRLYEYVTATMAYDATLQSWKGSTEHALACSIGNCNDIHALLISLCRSIGVPARLVLGQAFEPPPPGEDACELCGYHCWAEFFAPRLGWVPADASCACKYKKHALFGAIEMNHVAWSTGRDILLVPSQQATRILFFAGPYAEANGLPYRAVDRRVSFSDLL
jgi:transglutaminase-like putative cysteine protease